MKWLGKFPDPFIEEIAGQPDALRRSAAGLAHQRSALLQIALAARRGRRPGTYERASKVTTVE